MNIWKAITIIGIIAIGFVALDIVPALKPLALGTLVLMGLIVVVTAAEKVNYPEAITMLSIWMAGFAGLYFVPALQEIARDMLWAIGIISIVVLVKGIKHSWQILSIVATWAGGFAGLYRIEAIQKVPLPSYILVAICIISMVIMVSHDKSQCEAKIKLSIKSGTSTKKTTKEDE